MFNLVTRVLRIVVKYYILNVHRFSNAFSAVDSYVFLNFVFHNLLINSIFLSFEILRIVINFTNFHDACHSKKKGANITMTIRRFLKIRSGKTNTPKQIMEKLFE